MHVYTMYNVRNNKGCEWVGENILVSRIVVLNMCMQLLTVECSQLFAEVFVSLLLHFIVSVRIKSLLLASKKNCSTCTQRQRMINVKRSTKLQNSKRRKVKLWQKTAMIWLRILATELISLKLIWSPLTIDCQQMTRR